MGTHFTIVTKEPCTNPPVFGPTKFGVRLRFFFFILRMTLTHTKSGDYFTSFWFISVHFLIAPTQGVHKIRIILHVSRMTADIDLRFGRIFHEQKQVHFLRLMTPPPLRLPSLSQGSGGNFRIFHKHHFSVIPHQKNDTEDDFSL